MEKIWVHKETEFQKGYVEYLLSYNNPIMCGREANAKHIESETFDNLAGLLALLDVHTQTTLCHTHLADAIQIYRIVMHGEDHIQNKTELGVDASGIHGHFSVSISSKDMVNRSTELLLYTEHKMKLLLQGLEEENNKPKEDVQ